MNDSYFYEWDLYNVKLKGGEWNYKQRILDHQILNYETS